MLATFILLSLTTNHLLHEYVGESRLFFGFQKGHSKSEKMSTLFWGISTCYQLLAIHYTPPPPTAQCSTTGYSLLSTGYSLLSTNYILYLLSTGKVNWLTSNYWPFITRYCNSWLFTANWLLTRVGKIWSSKGTCRYQNYLNQRTKSL